MEKYECNVTVACNGKQGVDLYEEAEECCFDIILMDIRMPIMDGITATKTIRESRKKDAKVIPIIAMTANAYEVDVEMCTEAGMNGHISKPINPQIMYKTIVDILDN